MNLHYRPSFLLIAIFLFTTTLLQAQKQSGKLKASNQPVPQGTVVLPTQINLGTPVVVNFSELAAYDLAHPKKKKKRFIEQGEDREKGGAFIPQPVPDDAIRVQNSQSAPPGSTTISSLAPVNSFNGTLDNGTLIPPDIRGAVGVTYVMETTNQEFKIYTKAGALNSTLSITTFFSSSGGSSYFDPHILYDANNGRFVICIAGKVTGGHQGLFLAVSQTSDPTGLWFVYPLDATGNATDFMDYPLLGLNTNWVVITGRNFTSAGPVVPMIFVFDRASVYSGSAGTVNSFSDATNGITLAPAHTYDNAQTTEHLVTTWNGSSGGSGFVRLSSLTGSAASPVYTTGSTIGVAFPWNDNGGITVGASQSGTTNKIESGDSRIGNAVFINGSLWFCHTAYLPAVSPDHSAADWWQVNPVTSTVQQFGRVETAATFYFYPSINVNAAGDALLGYCTSSSTTFPSAAYSFHASTDVSGTMQSTFIYKTGLANYFKTFGSGRNRYGDYTGCAVDPSDNSFWNFSEWAQAGNNWGTVIANVAASPAGVLSAITTSAVSPLSYCAGSSVSVLFTGNGVANAGNIFTAQLSNAAGSFASPVSIGTLSSINAGVISATIPGGTAAGAGYRIRVVSSNPVVTGSDNGANITVLGIPAAAGAIAGTATVCPGQTGVTYSVGAIANATGYNWSLPTGASITAGTNTNSITVSFSASASSGNVSVFGFNVGCSGTASANFPVTVGLISKTGNVTFTNSSSITINDNTIASRYPDSITVSGFIGGTQDVNVTLTGFAHTWKGDVDMLLESPTGQRILLLSDCGEIASSTTINLVFNDSAGSFLPASSALASGSFKPTNYVTPDNFVSPGPGSFTESTGATSDSLKLFNGFSPNGKWKLYIVDDATGDLGSLTSWSLSIIGPVPIDPPVISGPTTVCQGQTGVVYSIPAVANATGYNWTLPPGASITAGTNTNSITVTYSVGATSGNVAVTPTNSCNSGTPSANYAVAVTALSSTITGSSSVCSGSSTQWCAPAGLSSYRWNTGATTQCITVSAAGTYTDTVTNGSGCKSFSSQTLTVNALPSSTITGSSTVCSGSSVQWCAPAGLSSYAWSNGATTQCITVSAAGTYTDTVTNANGCKSFSSQTLTVNALPSSTITGSSSVCSGSSVQWCAPAGLSSYRWNTGATTQCITVSAAGTYTDTVTNANGCKSFSSQTLTVNALPSSTITGSSSVCSGSSVQWCAPAGLSSYAWSTGATTQCITVSAAGTYTDTVTNASGCKSFSSQTLTVNALPSSTITGSSSVCSGSSVQWCAPAGLSSYAWNTGATTQCINVSAAGTYTDTVINASGCKSFSSQTLTVNSLSSAIITGSTSVCSGSSTQWCAPSGLSSYAWSTGATTQCINVSAAGTYTDTVTNANGCKSFSSKTLTVNALPSSTITGSSSVCSGSSVQWCAPTGLSTYHWNTGATTQCINVSTAGTYTDTVTNANGCKSFSSQTLTVNSLPSSTITGSSSVCSGSSVQWCAPAGLSSYAWSTGATTQCITVSAAGTYTDTVTNTNGCKSFSSQTLTVNALPSSTITGSSSVCSGSSVQWCAPAGLSSYRWNTGTTTQCITVSAAGTYTDTVTNANGCKSFSSQTLTVNALPSSTITGSSSVCSGSSVQWCAPAGLSSYHWSTGATIQCITLNTAGTYTDTVTNANGCKSFSSQTLTVNPNCSVTLNLKVFIEGFYSTNFTMVPVADPFLHDTLCDTVTVQLHNASVPYGIVESHKGTISIHGNGNFVFTSLTPGAFYYIAIRHRNSVETWSKNPVQFNAPSVNFDFTSP